MVVIDKQIRRHRVFGHKKHASSCEDMFKLAGHLSKNFPKKSRVCRSNPLVELFRSFVCTKEA